MTKPTEAGSAGVHRRTVLQRMGVISTAGVLGVPTFSGSVLAIESNGTCGLLDIVCAIDTSGSLDSSEMASLEAGVNTFLDELPTDGSVLVGTFEFGGGGVRNKNDLQNPGGLTVSLPSSGSGNTPMPAALDIADQAVYGDSAQRSDAIKLVVVFTDGGPNYTNTTYSMAGLTAPRDDTAEWSWESDDSTYDNADSASATVTRGEMDETAHVAASIRAGSIGDGATKIATVYVGDDDTEAMTDDAKSSYTDLPTYLEEHIASETRFAIDVDIEDVEGLTAELERILADLCCPDCPAGFEYKYEWVENDEAEGECAGQFVIFDADDNVIEDLDPLELVSVSCDEDGEPQEACFRTSLCALSYTVKAGPGTATREVTFDGPGGTFCIEGLERRVGRGTVTHAISHIVFTCPDEEE